MILATSQLVYTHNRAAPRPSTHPDTDAVGQSRGPDTSIVQRPSSLRPPQCGIVLSEELLGVSALLVGGYTDLFTPQGNKFTLPWANTRDSGWPGTATQLLEYGGKSITILRNSPN